MGSEMCIRDRVYELDEQMKPTVAGGRYLDPEAAAAAAAAVANQGR